MSASSMARVEHGDMVDLINSFHSTVEKFYSHYQKADAGADGVDMAWDSAASDTLVATMRSWQQQCTTLTGQLEHFQESLSKVSGFYVEGDTNTSAAMSALASDIGSGIEATA